MINLEGGWWRWLPGPPSTQGGACHFGRDGARRACSTQLTRTHLHTDYTGGATPRVVWLRHAHLLVLWTKDEAYYLRWLLPWLVDPARRPPPVLEQVDGALDYVIGETAIMVEDGGSGVIRVTGSRRRGGPVA